MNLKSFSSLSSSPIFAGRCSALVVAAAGLISALPAWAQGEVGTPNMATTSQAPAISQETLDSLLAPIALYPDALLAQVLMASTYPMDVIEAARWQQEHADLSGQALQEALAAFDWDPSVKSLVTVPQVLQYMNDAPRWMQDLGQAVLADQPRVMASVQTLRQKARVAGTLASNDRQTVKVDTDATRKTEYITIAPASTQVVYVPVYDPYVVYGSWWWPSRPVYWGPPPGAVFSTGYFWGNRYYSSVALWGSFNWGGGVITINTPVYNTYYRAPPPMGPNNIWWRPAPIYAPPVGGHYRWPAQRPPYNPYVVRPPVQHPPSYAPGQGRHPRAPQYQPPGRPGTPPAVDSPRGNVPDDSRRTGGRMVMPDSNNRGSGSGGSQNVILRKPAQEPSPQPSQEGNRVNSQRSGRIPGER